MNRCMLSLERLSIERGKIFHYTNFKKVFNEEKRYKDIDFDDYMTIMDDYYLFKYAAHISRNAWLVFEWIRYLCRYDGFVNCSYTNITKIFCNGMLKISKPTFYKCTSELEDVGLIYKVATYSIRDNRCSNDASAYALVDMTDAIYMIADIVQNNGYHHTTVMQTMGIDASLPPLPQSANEEKPKKKNPKVRYKLFMIKFKEIKDVIEEFFMFLGSFNSTGRIAESRRLKILEELAYYYDGDFTADDITHAIMVTMKNTARSKNAKKENYMLSILRSMEAKPEEESENQVAVALSKRAEEKLEKNRKVMYKPKSSGVSEDEYNSHVASLNKIEGYYRTVISKFSNPSTELEEKLYKHACAIRDKFEAYKANTPVRAKRMSLLQKKGYYECTEYDSKWNRNISWCDENECDISPKKIQALLGSTFKSSFCKYDIIKGV